MQKEIEKLHIWWIYSNISEDFTSESSTGKLETAVSTFLC